MTNIVFTPKQPNYSITNNLEVVPGTPIPIFDLLNYPSSALPVRSSFSVKKERAASSRCTKEHYILEEKQDVYTRVTNKIITDLEKGNLTWIKPWGSNLEAGCISRPLRSDGTPYRGINVLSLWGTAAEKGYHLPAWMTYKRAQELGGRVNTGEKGTLVVYANKVTKSQEGDQGEETTYTIPFLKGYTVFNAAQISGLPETYYASSAVEGEPKNRLESVEAFIRATKAVIQHGGNKACYKPSPDLIQLPHSQDFRDTESYYAILCHELVHWTSHDERLNRSFGQKRFGDNGYAVEELVAEIGAAFLCADLGITAETREDHAAYIQSWLEVLKSDRRAIFTAASHAQQATDYLHGLNASVPALI